MNKWILIFYNLPTKPMSARMKYWRRLQKEGALPLKDSVYILPYGEDSYELCQWLTKEISAANGQMNFAVIDRIETMPNATIIDMFKAQSDALYVGVSEKIETLKDASKLNKYTKEYGEIKKTDFFNSDLGNKVKSKLVSLQNNSVIHITLNKKSIQDFQNRLWVTRKRPFVDRLASAWLIKRFIDKNAKFGFFAETEQLPESSISFDMNEATFTHIGSLCTFEALAQSFDIQDEGVRAIAKIIHQLDIKDDLYDAPEAFGILAVLKGIRNAEQDDHKLLQKGIELFDAIYQGGLK